MSQRIPNTLPFPGISYKVRINALSNAQKSQSGNGEPETSVTEISSLISFDDIKHLLSRTPLRRPNRTKPIS